MSRNGYRILLILVIVWMAVISVGAQDLLNINCINQYYHNWLDGVVDVCVDNNYTYLACSYDGLRILDTGNPEAVREVGHLVYTEAVCLAIYGNYLYLGTYPSGIGIFNISDPEAVVEVGEVPVGGVRVIRIYNGYAYVCSYGSILHIYSLDNPASPVQVWECPEPFYAGDVAFQDNMAYIACTSQGRLKAMDISDPSSPAMVDSFTISHELNGVAVSGDYAYLAAADGGFEVIDLNTMQLAAEIDSLIYAFDIRVDGDYAYMSYGDPDCPLAIIDISNPLNPQTLSIYYPPEDIMNFTLVDDLVYVADYSHCLRVVDVADRFEPFETFVYNDFGHDYDVEVCSNYAVLTQDYRFEIIDISNIANPVEIGFQELTWAVQEVEIADNVAYLVQSVNPVLTALDLNSPEPLTILGTLSVEYEYAVRDIEVYDHYAFLDYSGGILIVDIADPANMQEVGMIHERGGVRSLEICGHYLYYQSELFDLKVLDISDPINPVVLGTSTQIHYLSNMKATENRLYATWNNLLYVYDLDNLDHWTPSQTLHLLGDGSSYADIEINGKYLYATLHHDGLMVFDITDIASPQLIATCDTPGEARGLSLYNDIAIVADMTNLGFYDCSSLTGIDSDDAIIPQQFSLLTNYPNPFNLSTNIQFELASAGNVQITVYDALGRQVRNLANCRAVAGRHVINWDGTDAGGQTVASGRYYIQAVADGQTQSLPITLLK